MGSLVSKSDTTREHPPNTVDSVAIVDIYTEASPFAHKIKHDGMWYGLATAACCLLIFCALLAGLTLGVCGLEMTWLRMRGVTGTQKQRQRALVVVKLKRYSTWMLCSLIICSVAAGESFPFLIQALWPGHQQWIPILISTLSIAVFAEILPQYIIPKNAINWGYYCSPIIWICMFVTGIISYPLARLLDTISGNKETHEIFTNDEMAALIKYHDRSEKHGGNIDQDTTRIMLGALNLNSRKVGGDISRIPEEAYSEKDACQDVEKADLVLSHGMIVRWSAVKTINIGEPVDGAFIRKVKSWSYSRIPVVGGDDESPDKNWNGKQIFGFLHIKNLLGLEIDEVHNPKDGICVRDLPLYPLPIIQEQVSIYELLDIFQLGMSRMAIVVPRPSNLTIDGPPAVAHSRSKSSDSRAPCWTATQRTNARIVSRMKAFGSQADWTTDWASGFLDASQIDIQNQLSLKENVVGIRSPKPVGIITFEDIIDTILQKTSRDERDFFDRDNTAPPTKKRKAGDFTAHHMRSFGLEKENSGVLTSVEKPTHLSFQRPTRGTVRKRKVSKAKKTPAAMDGAEDGSLESADDHDISILEATSNPRNSQRGRAAIRGDIFSGDSENKLGQTFDHRDSVGHREESSYTQNSQGGFHDAEPATNVARETAVKVSSLPSRRGLSSLFSEGVGTLWRNVSATTAPPQMHSVISISRDHYPNSENRPRGSREVLAPSNETQSGTDNDVTYCDTRAQLHGNHENHDDLTASMPIDDDSGLINSLSSWNYGDLLEAQDQIGLVQDDSVPVVESGTGISRGKPYSGFPPELLDTISTARTKGSQDYVSKTLPRMPNITANMNEHASVADVDTPVREQSFHDDRILLPSQRRELNSSAALNVDGMRSSSFWV